ncbi:MAG: hypothetical protein ACP5PZ_02505 [Bacteroidales bacterium]
MGNNFTLVFIAEDNADDEESSQVFAKLLDWQVQRLREVWEIDEESVPPHLTRRILSML